MGTLLRHGINMYKKTMNQAPGSEDETPVFLKEIALPGSKTKPIAPLVTSQPAPQQKPLVPKNTVLNNTVQKSTVPKAAVKVNSQASGGIEAARRILYAAKGAGKGEALLNRAVPESRENFFGFLDEFTTDQLVKLFKEETAQTTALILSRMSPKISAGVINKLPTSGKLDVLKRIAHQGNVSPEILEQVSAAIKEKVRHLAGGYKNVKIDGMQTLAAILKQGDNSFGGRLIDELEEDDPEIGCSLKEKLYIH
ncbi:MAG: hypothetical protein FWD14_01435 [Treponema sp.]|nr:hypothetical protein [Treponema sp.]